MLGINNYNPTFYTDMNDLINNHGDKLRSLIGSTLEEIWTVHEVSEGEFWADCPVVFVIARNQFEFCSFKDSELSITWNKIDLKQKIDWYGSKGLNLEWRKNVVRDLVPYINKKIESVEIIELNEEINVAPSRFLHSPLLLNGIGFSFDDGYISVFNAFDETDISPQRLEKHKYTKV